MKFFVSDFHFGTIGRSDLPAKTNFESFCETNLSIDDELYILGDFFDFWMEYKSFVPAKFVEIYAILLNAKKRGIKIFFVRGNHDFIRGDFFENTGFKVFDKQIKFEQNGKKILCIHGDALSKNIFYKAINFFLTNGFFQFLYKLLPPFFAVWLAETSSNLSRRKNKYKLNKKSWNEKYRKYAFNFAEKNKCDILIMGHSHISDLIARNDKIYANCGAWFESPTFILLDKNKIFLKEFRGGKEKDIILCEKEF